MLGAPFVKDQGFPQRVPDGIEYPESAKYYDLTEGKYSISVSVGKSFQTRRQEGLAALSEILAKQPQLLPVLGDIWAEYEEWPGHKRMAERLERWREMTMPGLEEPEEGQITLTQAMAKVQGLEQQMQEMGQALQAAQQKIETDQVKAQATLQKTEMDNTSREIIARLDNLVRLQIESQKAQTKASDEDVKRQYDAFEKEADREHEAERDVFEADHERNMAEITGSKNELREPVKGK